MYFSPAQLRDFFIMDYIHLNGIKIYAYHGCLNEEKKVGGYFQVDISLGLNLTHAGETDQIKHSVDYAKVNEIVREEMQKPARLLEGIAWRILKKLESNFPDLQHIKIFVSKLNPPVPGEMHSVSVELESFPHKQKKL